MQNFSKKAKIRKIEIFEKSKKKCLYKKSEISTHKKYGKFKWDACNKCRKIEKNRFLEPRHTLKVRTFLVAEDPSVERVVHLFRPEEIHGGNVSRDLERSFLGFALCNAIDGNVQTGGAAHIAFDSDLGLGQELFQVVRSVPWFHFIERLFDALFVVSGSLVAVHAVVGKDSRRQIVKLGWTWFWQVNIFVNEKLAVLR